MNQVVTVDVTTLIAGDRVYYYNLDEKGNAFLDSGDVKDTNPYSEGVDVFGTYENGQTWRQYVSKYFVCKVEREGMVIFEQNNEKDSSKH